MGNMLQNQINRYEREFCGSWQTGCFVNRMPQVPSYDRSCWSGGCGSGWCGGWSFSDIIKDRGEVSLWECFTAGIKEQTYANPIGMLGTGLQITAIGTNLLGNLSNALAGLGGNNQMNS